MMLLNSCQNNINLEKTKKEKASHELTKYKASFVLCKRKNCNCYFAFRFLENSKVLLS